MGPFRQISVSTAGVLRHVSSFGSFYLAWGHAEDVFSGVVQQFCLSSFFLFYSWFNKWAFPRDVGIFLSGFKFVMVRVNDLVIVGGTNNFYGVDETEGEVRCTPTHPGCFYAFINLSNSFIFSKVSGKLRSLSLELPLSFYPRPSISISHQPSF